MSTMPCQRELKKFAVDQFERRGDRWVHRTARPHFADSGDDVDGPGSSAGLPGVPDFPPGVPGVADRPVDPAGGA